MTNDQDPLNVNNDVISVLTTTAYPAGAGVAVRRLLPGTKIESLTDQINLKYLFPLSSGRTCSGGSPRIQLYIDPGDGTTPHNAFGYVGHGTFGTGCLTGMWDFVDMANPADLMPRWDLSQWLARGAACNMTCTWAQVVAFFDTSVPNHVVLSGGVYDDSCSFDTLACGKAYYDLVSIGNLTLDNRQDTVLGSTQ